MPTLNPSNPGPAENGEGHAKQFEVIKQCMGDLNGTQQKIFSLLLKQRLHGEIANELNLELYEVLQECSKIRRKIKQRLRDDETRE